MEFLNVRLRWSLLSLFCGFLLTSIPARGDVESLDGSWLWQESQSDEPPQDGAWESVSVPGCLYALNATPGFLKHTFQVPSLSTGERVRLRFLNLRYEPRIWINGAEVFASENGWEVDLELDVSDQVLPGESNEIVVQVHGWLEAVLSPSPVDALVPGDDPRNIMTNRVLEPFPGDFLCMGIVDSVQWTVESSIVVDEVYATTSLLAGTTRIHLRTRNSGDDTPQVKIAGTVRNPAGVGKTSFSLDNVLVAPGNQQIEVPLSWVPTDTWSPESPEFHSVAVEIRQGGTLLFAAEVPLGLREVRTSGPRVILNGESAVLSAWDAPLPANHHSYDDIVTALLALRTAGYNTIILNDGLWPEKWLDAADELGVLVVMSTALGCDPAGRYRLDGGVFAENMARQVAVMAKRAVRHPSVVALNLADGPSGCMSAARWDKLHPILDDLLAQATVEAPGRLLTVRGETVFDGAVDVMWLEHPFTPLECMTGNSCNSLDDVVAAATEGEWVWNQDDPLWFARLGRETTGRNRLSSVLGPRSLFNEASEERTVSRLFWTEEGGQLLSEGASLVAVENRVRGRFEHRVSDLGLLPPDWLPGVGEVALLRRLNGVQFAPGESRVITWDVVATGTAPLEGTATVLDFEGGVLTTKNVSLDAGESMSVTASIEAPLLSGASAKRLFGTTVEFQGESLATREDQFVAVPEPEAVPFDGSVGLFDPQGTLEGSHWGEVEHVKLSSLLDVDLELQLVIVAPDAFKGVVAQGGERVYSDLAQLLLLYVDGGGHLLVLEQSDFNDVLPFSVAASSMLRGFVDGKHPITEGMASIQFEEWDGDIPVVEHPFVVPQWGSFTCLVRGGQVGYEELCGLGFVRRGQGWILLDQLDDSQQHHGRSTLEFLGGRIWKFIATEDRLPAPRFRLRGVGTSLEEWISSLDLAPLDSSLGEECADVVILDALPTSLDAGTGALWVRPNGAAILDSLWEGWNPEFASITALPVVPSDADNLRVPLALFSRWGDTGPLAQGTPRAVFPQASGAVNVGKWGETDGEEICFVAGDSVDGSVPLTFQGMGTLTFEGKARFFDGGPTVLNVSGQGSSATVLMGPEYSTVKIVLPEVSSGENTWTFESQWTPQNLEIPESGEVCLRNLKVSESEVADGVAVSTLPSLFATTRYENSQVVVDFTSEIPDGERSPELLRATSIQAGELGVYIDTPLSVRIPATKLLVEESDLNYVDGGVVWLRDNGILSKELVFSQGGRYRFLVTGLGTPVNDYYPHPEVRLDGKSLGAVRLTGRMASQFLDATVEAGTHVVSMAFVDDALVPPEDRDAGFLALEVAALRGNQPPTARIVASAASDGVELSCECLNDPDGDAVTRFWALSADSCPIPSADAPEGESWVFDVPAGIYQAGVRLEDSRGAVTYVCQEIAWSGDTTPVDEGVVEGEPDTVSEVDVVADAVSTNDAMSSWDVVENPDSKKGGGGGCAQSGSSGGPFSSSSIFLLLALCGLLFLARLVNLRRRT